MIHIGPKTQGGVMASIVFDPRDEWMMPEFMKRLTEAGRAVTEKKCFTLVTDDVYQLTLIHGAICGQETESK